MTNLTAPKRPDIQKTLEETYKEYAEGYLQRLDDLTNARQFTALGREVVGGEYAENIARSELLLDQTSKISMSNLGDAERLGVQRQLEKRKTQLIEEYEDPEASAFDKAKAAEGFAENDVLLKNFNKVTQAQVETQINRIRNHIPTTRISTGP
jgi:hypothetical protein